MNRDALQQLRNLPIEEVAQRLGIEVRHHKALCPFHNDSHPSLSFHVQKNTFRCFVCDAHGGPIDLVMRHLGTGFLEACQWLSGTQSLAPIEAKPAPKPAPPSKPFNARRYEPYFLHPWLTAEAQQFLYTERRLDPRVVRWCRLTSWNDLYATHWLQIPYFNQEGHLIGIQNRNLTPGAEPRFRFPQGSQCGIYNLPILALLKPQEPLYITEGCSDCWAMLSAGNKAIAIPSATLLNPRDVDLLVALHQRLDTPFHMYPDNDAPGERLFLQLQRRLPNLTHHHLPPDCKDFSDHYRRTLSHIIP